MDNKIKNDCIEKMQKSIVALTKHLQSIRTGRAHASLFDDIYVDYYGSKTRLKEIASINVEDARSLAVIAWDKKAITPIEKAIRESELGLNPITQSDVIRVPLPALTTETRNNYIRQAKQEAENAKIAIRNIRRDTITHIKNSAESEDSEHTQTNELQKITDQYIKKVDELLAAKEHDLAEI